MTTNERMKYTGTVELECCGGDPSNREFDFRATGKIGEDDTGGIVNSYRFWKNPLVIGDDPQAQAIGRVTAIEHSGSTFKIDVALAKDNELVTKYAEVIASNDCGVGGKKVVLAAKVVDDIIYDVTMKIVDVPSWEEFIATAPKGVILVVDIQESLWEPARKGHLYPKTECILRVKDDGIVASERGRTPLALIKRVDQLKDPASNVAKAFGPSRSARVATALVQIAGAILCSDNHPTGFSLRPYSRYAMASLAAFDLTPEIPTDDAAIDLITIAIEDEAKRAERAARDADLDPSIIANACWFDLDAPMPSTVTA